MKNVAIVGCGNISEIYLKNLTGVFQSSVTVYGVCDLVAERAKEKAEKYQIGKILTFDQVLQDPNVDIVLNLTTPLSHYSLCKRVIEAGKSVYVEKPLSVTYAQGAELVELAKAKGVLLGCAPDTFLGAGLQTCRRIIDQGLLGNIVGATAFMVCGGHESWHPDPAFYYKAGAGPMFDMGPYYLTALVNMLGSVESISGMTTAGRARRRITSQPHYGEMIDVEVPTHIVGMLRFRSGAIGNIITSFDVYGSTLPRIEIYGTRGSMIVPDPNTFGGTVLLKQAFDKEFKPYPLLTQYSENSRGLGVADMAQCLTEGRSDLRTSGDLALHVLEIMESIQNGNNARAEVSMRSDCQRPKAMEL